MKDMASGKELVSAENPRTASARAKLRARSARKNGGLNVEVGPVYKDTRGVTIFYCCDVTAQAHCIPDEEECGIDRLRERGITKFLEGCNDCYRNQGNSTPSHTS